MPRTRAKPAARPRHRQLTIRQILAWADDFHRRTGHWPIATSGRIPFRDESWGAINAALARGHRGLSGGGSLARLLKTHPTVPNTNGIRIRLTWPTIARVPMVPGLCKMLTRTIILALLAWPVMVLSYFSKLLPIVGLR